LGQFDLFTPLHQGLRLVEDALLIDDGFDAVLRSALAVDRWD
jgi:hypothetical protein